MGPFQLWSDGELVGELLDVSAQDAGRMLVGVGGLGELRVASVRDLAGKGAIDRSRARRLKLAAELGRRINAQALRIGAPLPTAADVDALLRPRLVGLEQEELHVLGVTHQRQLLSHSIVARGSLEGVVVSTRDVFRGLVRDASPGAIVVHNHPHGPPTPSDADRLLTAQLAAAGHIVGVQLVDHIILARGGWYSFANAKFLSLEGAISDDAIILESRSASARMPEKEHSP